MLRCPRRGCGVCQDKEVGFGSASGGRLMSLGWDLRYTWDWNSSRECPGPGRPWAPAAPAERFWDGVGALWAAVVTDGEVEFWSLTSPCGSSPSQSGGLAALSLPSLPLRASQG